MTGTDIARMEHAAVAVLGSTNEALSRLGDWVTAAQQAHSLVAPLVGTPFVPDAYKPRVEPRATAEQRAEAHSTAVANATAAVLQGITLGIDPLMALQQIYIVHGRPGLYAKMMVALVQSRGHEVWTVDGECSDTRAVVYGRRRGTEHTERVVVTMDQARKAGWTSNQAYTKTPGDMLWNRAAARVCDRIASDVLKGIASVEEIQDTIQATAEVGNGQRTVRPRQKPAPAITAVEDPPLEDEPVVAEPEPAAAPAEPMMTKPQSGKMFALLTEKGYSDKDAALAFISITIGREIESRGELTKAEAITVIDRLESLSAPESDEPSLDDDWPPTAPAGEAA